MGGYNHPGSGARGLNAEAGAALKISVPDLHFGPARRPRCGAGSIGGKPGPDWQGILPALPDSRCRRLLAVTVTVPKSWSLQALPGTCCRQLSAVTATAEARTVLHTGACWRCLPSCQVVARTLVHPLQCLPSSVDIHRSLRQRLRPLLQASPAGRPFQRPHALAPCQPISPSPCSFVGRST